MSVRIYGKKATKRKLVSDLETVSSKKLKLDSTGQPSTPNAARDLSHIFDTALSSSAPSTPNKLAKRMLGRSKTESSIGDPRDSPAPNNKSLLDRTFPLPSFTPAKPSLPAQSTSVAESSSSPQRPAIVNKHTYAGKSRSFLVELTADQSLPEELQDDYNNRESYAVLRTRWGVDNSEDDPYLKPLSPSKSNTTTPDSSPSKRKGKGKLIVNAPSSMIQPLRSITEIRDKGESRRFLDEVGYLLEGMGKDETPASKKASALEIISRLCESDFVRQAKAADFLQSTWDAFIEAGGGTGEDKVFDTLLIAFAALVSRDLVSLLELAQRDRSSSPNTASQSSFVTMLFSLVASVSPAADPLLIISQNSTPDERLKKTGIMKTDRAILKTLHSTISSRTRIFSSKIAISNALLLTHTLAAIPADLLSHAHVFPLLRSLRAQMQPVMDALSHISSLGNANSSIDTPSSVSSKATKVTSSQPTVLATLHLIPFSAIHDLLALLDGYLLAQWAPSSKHGQEMCRRLLDDARDAWLANGLVAVGIASELMGTLAEPPEGKNRRKIDPDSSSRCTEIVFRVLVSLTHSDPHWGQTLTKNSQAMLFVVRTIVRADDLWGTIITRTRKFSPSLSNEKTAANGKNHTEKIGQAFALPKVESIEDAGIMTDYASSEDSENGDVDQPTRAAERSSLTRALDWLCLSLGLLTNLVQVVDETKMMVRNTILDPDCIYRNIPCINVCSCRRPTTVLNILLTTYKHQLPIFSPTNTHSTTSKLELPEISPPLEVEEQEAEADASFLLGHLSVLFGLLMMDSPRNQEIVLDALPLIHHKGTKPSSNNTIKRKQQKIAQLVENASELGVFYAVISRRGLPNNGMALGAPDSNGAESDAARGADIAKGVISFLQDLHDDC